MRIAIVEDYPPVAKSLARMVTQVLGTRAESIRILGSLDAAVGHLEEHPIDLLLLDLDLGGEDGFEILKSAVAASFFTIVVSANTHRALESYEYGVLDFVPKPVERGRLEKALERLDVTSPPEERSLRYLAVRSRDRVDLVPIESILYIQGAGKYSELHLDNDEVALHDKNLEKLEMLLPQTFRRVHKSYVANMKAAVRLQVQAGGSYSLELTSGESIPVGRTRYREIKDELI